MSLKLKPYPEYKESGVPWLGKIPREWETGRAKWLFRKKSRPFPPTADVVTCFRDGIVTLRKNRRERGFTESLKEIGYQGVKKGDLVIHAMDAFAGAVGVSDSEGKCTPVYAVCEPIDNAITHFYAHVVRQMARSQWIAALAKGIRERSTDFRFEGFANQIVPIPPNEKQVQIAQFLAQFGRWVNRLIRSKLRLIELLNEQKQAIIYNAVSRGLDANVRLKPSGIDWLPEMPEHWTAIRVRDLASSLKTGPFGSQLHASDYVTNGAPLINPAHMKDGKICVDPNCSIGEAKAQELAQHILQAGDVVFARRGQLGRCALVGERESGWFCGTGSIRMRMKSDFADPEYLLQLLLSRGVAQWLSLQSVGATMENLSTAILGKLPLPLPPQAEQKAIVDYIHRDQASIDRAIKLIFEQICLLREYRTRLIADVVTGKLDVTGVKLTETDSEMDFDDDSELIPLDMNGDQGADTVEGLDE